jgi:hypothetical protein
VEAQIKKEELDEEDIMDDSSDDNDNDGAVHLEEGEYKHEQDKI